MENICAYNKKCGGCNYQGIDYKQQLKKKLDKVNSLIGKYVKVECIKGMDNPYHYRNKVTATFKKLKNGKIISGTYREGSHELVDIEGCQIEDKLADEIIGTIRKLTMSFKLSIYDEDKGTGLLRHVMIRRGFNTGEVLVVLVTATPVFPSKNNFCKELKKLHPEITSIVQNINGKRTSMVLGDKNVTVTGKGYIEDVLCGCRFRISPNSFYQINSSQTEVLYRKAIEYLELQGNERVIDAYCGIGTIGIAMANKVKEVIGVELNASAVKDAITNSKLNGVKNTYFIKDDAGEYMVKLAAKNEKIDAVIMDPPRTGSDEKFMSSVVKLSPEKVVYVSCGPDTLGRDLAYFDKNGYKAVKAIAVDMFPFTEHVETVCLLSKK
jgi:23S rRNA (uracil1939-C5)-methyltransferase